MWWWQGLVELLINKGYYMNDYSLGLMLVLL